MEGKQQPPQENQKLNDELVGVTPEKKVIDDLIQELTTEQLTRNTLTCKICAADLTGLPSYRCTKHPKKSSNPKIDHLIQCRLTGKTVMDHGTIQTINNLTVLYNHLSPQSMCLPCLCAFLSARASKNENLNVCPFIDKNDDSNALSMTCTNFPPESLIVHLMHQNASNHFLELRPIAFPEERDRLSGVMPSDGLYVDFKPTKMSANGINLTNSSRISLGAQLAILKHNNQIYETIQIEDPAAGTSLQRLFAIKCNNCLYLNLLDRSATPSFGIPLGYKCQECDQWMCTGCEQNVICSPPPPPTDDRSSSIVTIERDHHHNHGSRKRYRSPDRNRVKYKEEKKNTHEETQKNEDLKDRKLKIVTEMSAVWVKHSGHTSLRNKPHMDFHRKLLGIQGPNVNTADRLAWSRKEVEYRPIYLRTVIEKARTKCPRCFTAVVKDEQCTHVTCVCCQCNFCYCCGGIFYPTFVEYQRAQRVPLYRDASAALYLPTNSDDEPLKYYDAEDVSANNVKQYSYDLHHLPFNRSNALKKRLLKPRSRSSAVFDFRDLRPSHTSCPKMLYYLPEYAQIIKDQELMDLLSENEMEWELSEYYRATHLDRYTGQFEIAKIVGSLRNLREVIGTPIFNDCVDQLRFYVGKNSTEKDRKYWPYVPSETDLVLFRTVLSYFHIKSSPYLL